MKRVISAAIMLPTVLLVFILGNKYVVDVFMGIIALRCIHELFHAFEVKGHHPVRWVGYISAIAIMFIHVIPKEYAIIAIATILPLSILALFIVVLSKKTKTDVIDIAITFFGICYIVLFLMFMSIIRDMENGKFLIWYVFISSWLTDVFAYITGKAIGKHHFTDISPNKTIEGCIGGTLGATICMIIYTVILNNFAGFNINIALITITGIILSIVGQIGDLSASSIKRYVDIKDYSNLIPGHGGMLDRIDSLIFLAPFAYALFTIL
jgi:phosphatidate cytidylyltransferase